MSLDATAPTATHPDDTTTRQRARGRWKILRAALLQQNESNGENNSSIHGFAGFALIPEPRIMEQRDHASDTWSMDELQRNLTRIHLDDDIDRTVDTLLYSLAALQALPTFESNALSVEFMLEPPLPTTLDSVASDCPLVALDQIDVIRNALQGHGYDCSYHGKTSRLLVQSRPDIVSNASDYCLKEYRIPLPGRSNAVTILTRERFHRRMTVHELVSHRTTAVDNTGNICVWDCERTLTWALLHHFVSDQRRSRDDTPVRILEMGAGMAALAALSLATAWAEDPTSSPYSTMDVHLTDGHEDCVVNNHVHTRVMRAAGLLPDDDVVRIQCRSLLWSLDLGREDGDASLQASWTLLADCTHFQEWHSELLWTLLYHTCVGGQIWMCQPHRGTSWHRFVRLVDAVNHATTTAVVSLSEPSDVAARLQARHDQVRDCPTYEANIHRPYVFVLTKLRDATSVDRECLVRFKNTVGTRG